MISIIDKTNTFFPFRSQELKETPILHPEDIFTLKISFRLGWGKL
jgi:hypothetical protein